MALEKIITQVKRQAFITKGIPDILSFGVGLGLGYAATQGPVNSDVVSWSARAAILAKAGTGAYDGFIDGIAERTGSLPASAVRGSIVGISTCTAELGLGYCIGYTLGNVLK